MHKLTSVEAQRVMSVLAECHERLGFISCIPEKPQKDVIDKLDEFRCLDCSEQIRKMWRLEDDLHASNNTKPGFTNPIDEQEAKSSVKALCRCLRDNKSARDVLNKHRKSKFSQSMTEFIKICVDTSEHTYRKLCTTVEDDHSKKSKLTELIEKANTAEENRQALDHQLKLLRQDRARETTNLQQIIQKMTKEIDNLKKTSQSEVTLVESQEKETRDRHNDLYAKTTEVLNAEHATEKEACLKAISDHQAEEAALRKKKGKLGTLNSLLGLLSDNLYFLLGMLENELQSWIEKYDKDMSDLNDKFQRTKELLAEEKKEREELEEYFRKLDAENDRIQREEAFIEQLRARERKATMVLEQAAVRIQKIFRGWQVRRALKKNSSKKKSKKKKK